MGNTLMGLGIEIPFKLLEIQFEGPLIIVNVEFASVSYSNSPNSRNSHNLMLLICLWIEIVFASSFQISMLLS
jgi:hypothetical protein